MKTPTAAAELAAAALSRLTPAEQERAQLPARIAAARTLTPADHQLITSFWAKPADTTDPRWRLASALLGGEPMRRVAAATLEESTGDPAPPEHTGAMCAAMGPALPGLAIPDGLTPDDLHVTLGFWPDAADDIPLRETVNEILAEYSSHNDTVSGVASHVSWLGGPDVRAAGSVAVVYEVTSPGLHQLSEHLNAAWETVGTAPSNRFAFRPHITLTYLPETEAADTWPEGPLDTPIPLTFDRIITRFGDTETTFTLEETGRTAAAATPNRFPTVQAALNGLTSKLNQIDRDTTTETRTAVELGFASALDRVGRMVTRATAGDQGLAPARVAAAATLPQLEAVNPGNLIAPAIEDTVTYVTGLIDRARAGIEAAISETLHVDLSDVWTTPTSAVGGFLRDSMTATIETRLGSLSDLGRIDPTDGEIDPLKAPFQITRNTLAYAAGAVLTGDGLIDRDEVGRPRSAAGTPATDTLGAGPDIQQAINDALTAHSPTPVTAAATPRSFIPDDLSAELAQVAAALTAGEEAGQNPLDRITTYTWRINWNGAAQQNLPEHEVMEGTVAADPSELERLGAEADILDWPFIGNRYPGDHPYCHCGWETNYTLVPRQLELV